MAGSTRIQPEATSERPQPLLEDLVTKKQESFKTRDKDEAYRLVAAKNETEEAPAFSLHLARVYWKAGDLFFPAQNVLARVVNEVIRRDYCR